MTIGDEKIATQLNTGALPNVISHTTAEWIILHQRIKPIPLRRPVLLKLADGKLIKTLSHIIKFEMKFNQIRVKIPFYVVDSKSPMCIIGRLTMKILAIQPMINEGYAYCAPKWTKKRAVLRFMDPGTYQGVTCIKFEVPKEYEHEAVNQMSVETKAVDWGKIDEEDRDNGPELFRKKLRTDLDQAVKMKSITQEQADKAYMELVTFADV
ncbi:hypothetical protein U1Q18_047081 [Sarracenia purpurea var. burkii]